MSSQKNKFIIEEKLVSSFVLSLGDRTEFIIYFLIFGVVSMW